MRLRVRLRTIVVLGAILVICVLYNLVDIGYMKEARSVPTRKLQIARITSEDIAKLAGQVRPAAALHPPSSRRYYNRRRLNDPPPPPPQPTSIITSQPRHKPTTATVTNPPYQIPFLAFHAESSNVGNLHYDESDVIKNDDVMTNNVSSDTKTAPLFSDQKDVDVSSNVKTKDELLLPESGQFSSPEQDLSNLNNKKQSFPTSNLKKLSPEDDVSKVLSFDIQKISQSNVWKTNNTEGVRQTNNVNSETNSENLVKESHNEQNNIVESDRIISKYTKEKELIALAPFEAIPVDKRKKLELYLSRLSEEQFNYVFKSIVGDENTSSVASAPKTAVDSKRASDKDVRQRCVNGCGAHKSLGARQRGYAARVAVESITLPIDWSSSPEDEQRLKYRQQHVQEVCHKYGLDKESVNNTINAWEFLISPEHKLVWCSVFKAASSTWFYNFNILAGYSENRLLKAKETPIALARKKYPRPSVAELLHTMNQTEKPLSFMIARHPLHRLVSGYRDKLLSGKRFYSNLAHRIVKAYPALGDMKLVARAVANPNNPLNNPDSLINSIMKKSRASKKILVPTFPQFVQFIIDADKHGERLDEHWAPMYSFCSPCLFQFDVIAKIETLDEDANYVIFESGIQDIIKPKRINRNRSAPTDKVADSFLCQLSRPMMEQLVNLYIIDMELFEYEYSHYMNCTSDQVRLEKVNVV